MRSSRICGSFDEDWSWYRVESRKDTDAVILANYEKDCTANEFEPSEYPCWIVAVSDGDGYGAVYTRDEVQKMLDEYRLQLDELIEKTEMEMK